MSIARKQLPLGAPPNSISHHTPTSELINEVFKLLCGSLANHALHFWLWSNGLLAFFHTRQGICCCSASLEHPVFTFFPNLGGSLDNLGIKGSAQRTIPISCGNCCLWPHDRASRVRMALESLRKGRVGVHRLWAYLEAVCFRDFSRSQLSDE